MEDEAATLHRDVHAAETAIAKSTVKQQALQLQRTMAQLEAEKAQVLEEQQQLADPRAGMDALQV